MRWLLHDDLSHEDGYLMCPWIHSFNKSLVETGDLIGTSSLLKCGGGLKEQGFLRGYITCVTEQHHYTVLTASPSHEHGVCTCM